MNDKRNKHTLEYLKQKGKRTLWLIVNFIFFKNSLFRSQKIHIHLLEWFGATISSDIQFGYGCDIKHPWNLRIEEQANIGNFVKLDCLNKICIENNVFIGNRATLHTSGVDLKKLANAIRIKDKAVIEAHTTIHPGVIAYSHSVLKVGSIAFEDLAPGAVYCGAPAQFIAQNISQFTAPSRSKPKNGLFLLFSAFLSPVIE